MSAKSHKVIFSNHLSYLLVFFSSSFYFSSEERCVNFIKIEFFIKMYVKLRKNAQTSIQKQNKGLGIIKSINKKSALRKEVHFILPVNEIIHHTEVLF